MSDDAPRVQAQPTTPTCPQCHRDLELRVETRINGRVHVALACARHGSFPQGWQPKFLGTAQAMRWAAQRRAIQQQRSRR